MNAVLISEKNTDNEEQWNIGEEASKLLHEENIECIHYCLERDSVHYCLGCYSCWIRTPGVCRIKDPGIEIAYRIRNCDLLILISRLRYGCYSSVIKGAMERLIGNILPYFKELGGRMHHAPRYARYPEYVMIAYGSNISRHDEALFKKVVQANVINMQKTDDHVYFCKSKDEIGTLLDNMRSFLKGLPK